MPGKKPDRAIGGKLLLVYWLLVLPGTVSANPFMGTQDSALPMAPQVKPASAAAPWLVQWQQGFRDSAAGLIDQWQENPGWEVIMGLLGATFLYGLIHALGPGHRKSVVFSLFLGRNTPWWKPPAAGFLSAGIHALSSLVLVGLLSLVQQGVAKFLSVDQAGRWMEYSASWLLLLLALVLLGKKLWEIIRHRGHSHGAEGDGGSVWSIILSTSIVPCPGATMVLLLSLYADLPWLGVMGVLSMSLGMGVVVAGAGLLAWMGRSALFHRLKTREKSLGTLSEILELLSYGVLLLLALFMIL